MRLIEADTVYAILESCEIKKDTYGSLLNDWDHGYNCGIERAESEIECAPTVDAVPVEWIKAKKKRLINMRIDLDPDEVDMAYDLKAQIDVLEELIDEWAERKEE